MTNANMDVNEMSDTESSAVCGAQRPEGTGQVPCVGTSPEGDAGSARANADCSELRRMVAEDPSQVVCLDVESTGLDVRKDGVLSISIVDGNGDVLFDSLIHTYRRKAWREAQRIHGITPRMVRDAPSIPQVRGEVESILGGAKLIVGYNHVVFDIPILESNGITVPDVPVCDVMLCYARVAGPPDADGRHRYRGLAECAARYGYGFEHHRSLDDARAALHCGIRIGEGASGGRP